MDFMFKLLFSTLLLISVPLLALETSESIHTKRMLSDLDFVKKTFEESYAPAEWKRELFAWDLQGKFESAVNEVKGNKKNDIKKFQKSLLKFCKSTRDYHVSISFTSTEYASLPFDIRYRNGKYILVSVDEEAKLPLEIGDEILTIDGIPVETVVDEFQQELGEENKTATDRTTALQFLTRRLGRRGHQVPQGSITIEVKKRNSGKVGTCKAIWNYKPERISNPFFNQFVETIQERPNRSFLEGKFNLLDEKLNQKTILPYYDEMAKVFIDDGLPKDLLGSRRSIFSAIGKENRDKLGNSTAEEQISWIWNWFWRKSLPEDAKKFFDAQLIELPSGKYAGYVRISTFNEEEPEEAIKAFLSCIEYFQSEADLLLIDQINNPGGKVHYMYALASALTDHPLVMLKERKLLKQSDVLNAINLIDLLQDLDFDKDRNQTIMGFPVSEFIQSLLNSSRYILNQWELGHILTDPYPCLGMEVINPHPRVNFTKPIFILVNEMSASCGDEFPALLQDNKRATIIGTPTAGAGGSVDSLSFNNLNGIDELTYTTSITYRFDGSPLENLGVTPDIYFDFNNELYSSDTISADFSKILDILDSMTQGRNKSWLD